LREASRLLLMLGDGKREKKTKNKSCSGCGSTIQYPLPSEGKPSRSRLPLLRTKRISEADAHPTILTDHQNYRVPPTRDSDRKIFLYASFALRTRRTHKLRVTSLAVRDNPGKIMCDRSSKLNRKNSRTSNIT